MGNTINHANQHIKAAAPANRKWMLVLLTIAVTFYWASLYLYVPTLPLYAHTKTNNLAVIGVALSMYGLWQAIVRLPLGIAADWLGRRKPFLFIGFGLSALGAWVMATASDTNGLIAGRAITGLAAAAWVPLVALFSSQFPLEEAVRATSLLSIINSLSRVLSTAVTGTINDASGGYTMAFFLAAGLAGLALLVTIPVREIASPPKQPSLNKIAILITRRDVLVPAMLSAVSQYVVWATTFGFMPDLAKSLGATGEMQSFMVSLYLGIGIGGNLITTWLVSRIGKKRLIYLSFLISLIGMIFAALSNSLYMIILAQCLIGFSQGIGYPLFMGMSIEKVVESERTTAMGLHQAVYAIGMFAGPWLSGILAKTTGIPIMFIITAVGTTVVAVALAQLLPKK